MGLVSKDDGWRVPDRTWERMVGLLPARPSHPLGCHNPRVPDRRAMDAILLVLRTGMQWNALNGTGICTSSSAHRRFQEWVRSITQRRARKSGSCSSAFFSSPRARMCGMKPSSSASAYTSG